MSHGIMAFLSELGPRRCVTKITINKKIQQLHFFNPPDVKAMFLGLQLAAQ
jgi:hypothetical protein